MGKKSNKRGKRASTHSAGNKRATRSAVSGGGGVGGKSKSKKAKAVKKTLKNINVVNRSKVDAADRDLLTVQDSVRRNVAGTAKARGRPRKSGNTANAALAKRAKDLGDLQRDTADGLKKLDNMDIAAK